MRSCDSGNLHNFYIKYNNSVKQYFDMHEHLVEFIHLYVMIT